MARKPRVEIEGGLYTSSSVAIIDGKIFNAPADYEKFLSLLSKGGEADE